MTRDTDAENPNDGSTVAVISAAVVAWLRARDLEGRGWRIVSVEAAGASASGLGPAGAKEAGDA